MIYLLKQKILTIIKKSILDFYRTIVSVSFYVIDTFIMKHDDNYHESRLLIIKFDELGDYILFRDYLKVIRHSKKFRTYKITLAGNVKWKELSEHFDGSNYDEAIWIDKKKFITNIIYRKIIFNKIYNRNFDTVLNPSSSRNFLTDDSLVRVAKAAKSIGFVSDTANSPKLILFLSDSFYSRNMLLPKDCYFEFYRNKYFFETLLEEEINLIAPYLGVDNRKEKEKQQKFVLVSPGAGIKYRQWSARNYAIISNYINKNYGYKLKIIGGESERDISIKIINHSEITEIEDLTGKTSLLELIDTIASSGLVITNDTGTSHISAALGIKTLVISNGSRFGRFNPYPDRLGLDVTVIYPSQIMDIIDNNYESILKAFKYKSYLNIDSVSLRQVESSLDELLSK